MAYAPTRERERARRSLHATWASGDDAEIGTLIVPIAERLADAADFRAGSSVLDVACGTGNMALAAARIGCVVTGVDHVGHVLERAGRRAGSEGLDVAFAYGDAARLPFRDSTFDAAASVMGSMFAPTMTVPRRSCSGSRGPAARSRSRAGLRSASSARCSGRSP